MRVLGSTVLVLEAIVVFLAALVAAGTGAVDGMGRSLLIGGLLALAPLLLRSTTPSPSTD